MLMMYSVFRPTRSTSAGYALHFRTRVGTAPDSVTPIIPIQSPLSNGLARAQKTRPAKREISLPAPLAFDLRLVIRLRSVSSSPPAALPAAQ